MKATLYTWDGTPETGHKRALGTVRIDTHSPAAVWDEKLDGYFNPNMPRDPRTGEKLDPTNGHEFVQAMPYVFRSAPYTWAEVEL